MSHTTITKLMSHSLDQFDKNPKGHYTLTRGTNAWGLPPGAQLYRAAKVAIDEGTSYNTYSRTAHIGHARSGRQNGTSVPAINPRGGMVGQETYTSYKTHPTPRGTNPKDRYAVLKKRPDKRDGNNSGARSLPVESNTDRPHGSRRVGSAPQNKKQASSRRPGPAKVNTLVAGSQHHVDTGPRGPAGSSQHQVQAATSRPERVTDVNKSIREWEGVRAAVKPKPESDEQTPRKKNALDTNISFHSKNPNVSAAEHSDIQEHLDNPPDTSRVLVMGGKQNRHKTDKTDRDEKIRRTLRLRHEDKQKRDYGMNRKNTTLYRSDYSLDVDTPRRGGPTRRERTRAQIDRRKTELVTRAKTKDRIREKNLKNFVVVENKKDIDLELYKLEQQMHIYLQTNGLDVNTSDFGHLRPKSRATNYTMNTTARSDMTVNTARKSAKGKLTDRKRRIPPWHRKEYVLNKRETEMYQHLNKVYRNDNLRENRENAFLKKVEALQVEEWKRLWYQYEGKLQERDHRRVVMQRQLQDVRQKYADDRWDRIAKFPVNRIAVHDDNDRHEYGLPADLNEEYDQYAPKIAPLEKKPKDVFDSEEHAVKNKRRYDPIFDVYRKTNARKRRPKMEGVDVFVINDDDDEGAGKKRRVGVKQLVKDAEGMLEAGSDDSEWEDEDSPRKIDAGLSNQDSTPKDRGTDLERNGDLHSFRRRKPPHDTSLNRSKIDQRKHNVASKYSAYGTTLKPRDQDAAANRRNKGLQGTGAHGNAPNDGKNKPRFKSNIRDFRSIEGFDGPKENNKKTKAKTTADVDEDATPVIQSSIPMNTAFPGAGQSSTFPDDQEHISKNATNDEDYSANQLQNESTKSKESITSKSSNAAKSKKKNSLLSSSIESIYSKQTKRDKSDKTSGDHNSSKTNLNDSKTGKASQNDKGKDKKNSKHAQDQTFSKDYDKSGKNPGDAQKLNKNDSNEYKNKNKDGASRSMEENQAREKTGQANGPNSNLVDQNAAGNMGNANGANNDHDTSKGSQGLNVSGGSDKENSKPKHGKTVRIIAPAKPEPTKKKKRASSPRPKNTKEEKQTEVKPTAAVKSNKKPGSPKVTKVKDEQGYNIPVIRKGLKPLEPKPPTKPISPNVGKFIAEYNPPEPFEPKKSDKKPTRPISPKLFQKGMYKEPAKFEVKKSEKELTKAQTPKLGVSQYKEPAKFEVRKSDKEATQANGPELGQKGDYEAPDKFEVKKSEKEVTKTSVPNFGQGDYKEPEKFEIKKSDKELTKAEGPNFGRGEYQEPSKFEVKKSDKELTKGKSPTLGVGEYEAPEAYQITKTTRRTTRAVSPSLGQSDYQQPKAYEPPKRERVATRAQSPGFAQRQKRERNDESFDRSRREPLNNTNHRRDYAKPGPDERHRRQTHEPTQTTTGKPGRKIRKETTKTTKTIRRRRGGDGDESGDEDLPGTRTTRKRTPPKRERAPPRRSQAEVTKQDPQRPDVPSPELATDTEDEDDDIFEKAMRKYGIVLDDD